MDLGDLHVLGIHENLVLFLENLFIRAAMVATLVATTGSGEGRERPDRESDDSMYDKSNGRSVGYSTRRTISSSQALSGIELGDFGGEKDGLRDLQSMKFLLGRKIAFNGMTFNCGSFLVMGSCKTNAIQTVVLSSDSVA